MYDGMTDMKRAAKRPASGRFVHSLVKKKVDIAVNPENTGARKTQILRMSIGSETASNNHLALAAVPIMPGKTVPPITLPSGYHDSLSYQFQKAYHPSLVKNLVDL